MSSNARVTNAFKFKGKLVMATNKCVRYIKYEQKVYNARRYRHKQQLIVHGIVMMLIMTIGLRMCLVQATNKKQGQEAVNSNVSTANKVVQTTIPKQMVYEQVQRQETERETEVCSELECNKGWSTDDDYLMAKIVMAEAEECNIQTKVLVAMVVLNRVQSDQFPNTVRDVIFQQCAGGTYQFSPIGDGRWDSVEPNEDCYEAIEIVKQSAYDYSGGALYFENCTDKDNWHSRNLEYLYESEGIRFYK